MTQHKARCEAGRLIGKGIISELPQDKQLQAQEAHDKVTALLEPMTDDAARIGAAVAILEIYAKWGGPYG